MDIFISGSLAYDRIMDFPGHFADHILPDKIHVLNVCFNINGLVEKFGGTAGNIAYTLAALGESPYIVATSGKDFDRYEQWLNQNRLPTGWIKRIPDVLTAGAYITTDLDDNQITAFNPGAMAFEADLPPLNSGSSNAVVFIGPGNKTDMMSFADKARQAGVAFFFDPGQSLNIWTRDEIRQAVSGALCFTSNDYELSLFLQIAKWSLNDLYDQVEVVITTRGPEGVVLDLKGEKTLVPAVSVKNVLDPTGAGDAFRGGLLKGHALRMPWDVCCQMGVVAASHAVEHYGTQEHLLDWNAFCSRYEENFGPILC
ncbi:carbohydrate kinase family protein [Syntrophobacter fumaroxidans]|uniref:PfkB domain protein n=1 Tax=Syntrophobacter fumaroxidans (strain DSM 10017 / MPOB) TaxID=335543 RepID=A0LGE6_SYNFM|nr:carbohydrate kinase family protein [Syntrophobacter fumaroxidans]ABK16498.1 PfkB domain protein [Syntrophobacter fumaroxidans MPOB]